jgi:hypothetical protein
MNNQRIGTGVRPVTFRYTIYRGTVRDTKQVWPTSTEAWDAIGNQNRLATQRGEGEPYRVVALEDHQSIIMPVLRLVSRG